MNKPEAKPGQSLEEILASIRKALAEEEVQGGAESPAAAGPARDTAERPAPAKGDSLLGQLTVALNGSGGRETAPDDDLDDLLAPLPSKASGATAAEPELPPPASGEGKDPLWFLARKPAPESHDTLDEAAREPIRADDAAVVPEENTLTRLETLRSSLPPLFGADDGDGIKPEPVNFVQPASPKPKDFPAVPAFEKALDEGRETKAPPPEKAAMPQMTRAESTPLPTPPPPSGVLRPAGSVAPAAEAMASALAAPRLGGAKDSPAAAAQARALEEMIGKMLEPLIRNWLEANLPRLVEKVVREEVAVARASADKPDAAKG